MANQIQMPKRFVYLSFMIDTNRINARQKDEYMNKLEVLAKDNNVISMITSDITIQELKKYQPGFNKASKGIFAISCNLNSEETQRIKAIQNILFSEELKDTTQHNDVMIVFSAQKYGFTLITNDGNSKSQPGGILGHKNELLKIGVTVITAQEALELVRLEIRKRDDLARKMANKFNIELPPYIGLD